MKTQRLAAVFAMAAMLASCSTAPHVNAVPPDEARAIAKDAYLYGFAMIENYNTFYKQVVDEKAPEYVGGFGKFRHYSTVFTPDNRDVVTPNNDTPYSWAWLDLRAGPWVLSVPAVPKDRYYVMQFVDLFTQNFAYVGVRSTGFAAGNYLIAGPKWHGTVPPGITKAFTSETDIVAILGRTELKGPNDVANVKALQAQYKLQPLGQFLGKALPPPAPPITFLPYDKAKAQSHDFIAYLNQLLVFAEPPYPAEVALRERFAKIGIVPGAEWNAAKIDPATLAAIDEGVKDAQGEIKDRIAQTSSSNGLFGDRALLGTNYLQRDVAAAMGLYGNSLDEAWYGGFVGDGAKLSKIHFASGALPPAQFFWSLTLYELPDRFLYANKLERYSIGDRTKGLIKDPDGGLTIYIGHDSPGKSKEANWLPAPAGPYSLVARIYGPKPNAVDGSWQLPALEPVGVP